VTPSLRRGAAGEFVGTAFLLAAIVGSGIMADRLTDDTSLTLLANAIATGAVLAAVIGALAATSGAHFNPAVTLVARALGMVDTPRAATYVVAQVSGGAFGVVVANAMFDLPLVSLSTTTRTGSNLWLSEVVATFGLLLVIFGLVRSGRSGMVGPAVGAFVAGGYFMTASTGFANPAVSVARTLSDTFAGIAPGSAPAFVAAQVIGALVFVPVVRLLHPVAAGDDDRIEA
jgi:glycerol uptake facilitator-like aquaporin